MVANYDKRAGNQAAAKPPVSAHPAFPAIVALWFAALLGLGSMVLPVVLFEKLIELTGIGAIFPAAQPPLGVTARIIIALIAAGAGVGSGLFVARKVVAAQAQPAAPRQRAAAQNAPTPRVSKKPISALEELGAESLDHPVENEPRIRPQIAGRRRALSVTDESGPSEYLELAPLPGGPMEFEEPLDLAEFDEDAEEDTAPSHQDLAADAFGSSGLSMPRHFSDTNYSPAFDRTPAVMPAPPQRRFDAPLPDDAEISPAVSQPQETLPLAADQLIDAPLANLGMAALVERFALALQHNQPQTSAAEMIETAPPVDVAEAQAVPASSDHIQDEAEADTERGEASAERASIFASVPEALRPLDFSDPYYGYDDEDADADDDDLPFVDLKAAFAGQPRPFDKPAEGPKPDAVPEETGNDGPLEPFGVASEDIEDIEDTDYSSLLDMKRAFRGEQENVRIEEDQPADDAPQPVVIFPGQEQRRTAPAADGPAREAVAPEEEDTPLAEQTAQPSDHPEPRQAASPRKFDAPVAVPDAPKIALPKADPAETERALRDALTKLQRMSGAA